MEEKARLYSLAQILQKIINLGLYSAAFKIVSVVVVVQIAFLHSGFQLLIDGMKLM